MVSVKKIHTCQNVNQALRIHSEYPNSEWIAGGTDVIVKLRAKKYPQEIELVDISKLDELSYIKTEDDVIKIGALTTHQQILENEQIQKLLPGLASACGKVGSLQIRNHATIGGNIGNASPAADSVPVLVALDAELVCLHLNEIGEIEKRVILLEDYLCDKAYKRLEQKELISEIRIPDVGKVETCRYDKMGERVSLAIAIASCALVKKDGNYQVAYGSMSLHVKRQILLETMLNEKKGEVSRQEIYDCLTKCLSPISDLRGSAAYRMEVSANMLAGLLS